jgi:hypothetical protein
MLKVERNKAMPFLTCLMLFMHGDYSMVSKILCVSLKSRVIRYMFRNSNIKNKKNYLGFETDFITSTSIFICNQYGCFESCQFPQQKLQSIYAVWTFDPQLKKILTFSVKDRYQLNYFICIKDFNAETNTSLVS